MGSSYLGEETTQLRTDTFSSGPARDLASHFPDIAEAARPPRRGQTCAYRDCLHRAEPDCAVRAAQHIDPFLGTRYKSYRIMLAELLR